MCGWGDSDRTHHLVIGGGLDLGAPGRDAQPHPHLKILRLDSVVAVQRRMGTGHLYGEELAAVTLHALSRQHEKIVDRHHHRRRTAFLWI